MKTTDKQMINATTSQYTCYTRYVCMYMQCENTITKHLMEQR